MLSDEQIEEVRTFFASEAARAMFQTLEASCIAEWINGEDTNAREETWRMLQAVVRLLNVLRDAPAMKRLTQRAQERRSVQG